MLNSVTVNGKHVLVLCSIYAISLGFVYLDITSDFNVVHAGLLIKNTMFSFLALNNEMCIYKIMLKKKAFTPSFDEHRAG